MLVIDRCDVASAAAVLVQVLNMIVVQIESQTQIS